MILLATLACGSPEPATVPIPTIIEQILRRPVAQSSSTTPMTMMPMVLVEPGKVFLGGTPVGRLNHLDYAESDLRGMLVTPLYDVLVAEHQKQMKKVDRVRQNAHAELSIGLIFDPETPFRTVRTTMFTAGQAQFETLYFIAWNDDQPVSIKSQLPKIKMADKRMVVDMGEHPAGATLIVSRTGFRVIDIDNGNPVDVPCLTEGCPTPKDWDYQTATRYLSATKGRTPDKDGIIVVPHGDVPWQTLIWALDAARVDLGGRPLYGFPIIAGGAD